MKKLITLFITMVSALMPAFAESASADFSILLPEFVKVESVLSPVLIANNKQF